MKIKCLHWANQLGFENINYSDGCIRDSLERNLLIQVHIHGEVNYLKHGQEQELMNPWLKAFHGVYL